MNGMGMDSTWKWWERMRLVYNLGLVLAGFGAFVAYAILGSIFLSHTPDFEITFFTMIFQGFGYLVMMLVANMFYLLGAISEKCFRPKNVMGYRRVCFGLGFGLSVLLPFVIPLLVVVVAITG